MIKDGQLTMSNTGGTLQSVRIDNNILNTLILAVLTTIIAYQGKALFFDLVLGLKKRGVMTIRDLHIFLLSGESSPLAVLDALFRNDWLTRKRLRGDIPRDTKITRDSKRITFRTYVKLLFLLLIGPVVNIIAISLTLERDRDYTIGEAGLGGFQVGINQNLEWIPTEPDSLYCQGVPLALREGESALSRFFLCRHLQVLEDNDDVIEPGQAVVVVSLRPTGSITLGIQSDTNGAIFDVYGSLRSNGTVYYIKPTLTVNDAIQLSELGASFIRPACGSTIVEAPTVFDEGVTVSRNIDCPNEFSQDDLTKGLTAMQLAITFKEAPSLDVVAFLDIPFNQSDGPVQTPYFSADSLPLVRRSRGTASLLVLLIIAACVVILRVIARLFAYNDFPVAIEVVLRDRFGLPCCDSMLQNNTQVEYRKSFQLVESAHFGMSSDTLPVVDQFVGGSVE